MAINVTGEPRARQAITGSTAMIGFDIARDGRVLIARDDFRVSIRGLVPGETAEREFSWLDASVSGSFTRDGKRLVFSDESQNAGADYQVALRDVATGQVVRLGPGSAHRPSPDGKWVPALVASTGRVMLYPIGTGDAVTLDNGPIERYVGSVEWFPDGKRVTVCGNEAGKAPRSYEQEIPKGAPKPITPEGIANVLVAPDGRTLLAKHSGGFDVVTIGGVRVAAKGIDRSDLPIAWTNDGRSVIVGKPNLVPMPVERVDVATGTRTLLRELAPPDRAGSSARSPTSGLTTGVGTPTRTSGNCRGFSS